MDALTDIELSLMKFGVGQPVPRKEDPTLLRGEGEDADSEPALLPLLKHQLNEWRWIILNPKQALPHLQRESELRRATGDTQKLRLLKFQKSGK